MEVRRILRGEPDFPHTLNASGGLLTAEFMDALGNAAILQEKMRGLLCSVKCPGDIILKTFDTARALRDAGVTVIGGFSLANGKGMPQLVTSRETSRGRVSRPVAP